jgi:cytochrome c
LAGKEVRVIHSPSPRAPRRRRWRGSRIVRKQNGHANRQIEIAQGGKMRSSSWSIMAGAGLLLALGASAALAADLDHGKQVFQACAACHSDKPDALGPSLVGVIDRKAGSRDDFRYSNAMTRAGFNWDVGNLRQYLADPQAKVKGNRMPFSGLNDPKDVDDVIAYIGTLK